MNKISKNLKIAIDSPAAAGAGTVAKKISKHYNLIHLDTGKIYRLIAFLKIKYKKKFNYIFIKRKISTIKLSALESKKLLLLSYLKIYLSGNLYIENSAWSPYKVKL